MDWDDLVEGDDLFWMDGQDRETIYQAVEKCLNESCFRQLTAHKREEIEDAYAERAAADAVRLEARDIRVNAWLNRK